MKKLSISILILISLIVTLSSCGVRLKQDYDYDYRINIVSTSAKIFSTNPYGERMVGWMTARHDTVFLVLQFQFLRANHIWFQVPQGESIAAYFTDGTNISLINSADAWSHRGIVMGDRDHIANVYIPLSDNDMKILSSKNIISLNVQASDGNGQFAMKPRKDEALKKMIALMRPYLVK
jgi:hypothetical protein